MLIGYKGNAWNAAAVGAAGVSAVIDLEDATNVDVTGTTSSASTITIQLSPDGGTFYDHGTTISANGSFYGSYAVGSRFMRLKSGSAVTITASVNGK
jgi:propanediol dehydratase large subunit